MKTLVIPEFLRFCIVGGIAFVSDYALEELLVYAGLAPALARIISLAIALHISYALHGAFTYRDHRGYTRATWLQFMSSNIIGAFINYAVFVGVIHIAPFEDAGFTRFAGMVLGTAISMGFNYWANKRYAFARKEPQ